MADLSIDLRYSIIVEYNADIVTLLTNKFNISTTNPVCFGGLKIGTMSTSGYYESIIIVRSLIILRVIDSMAS